MHPSEITILVISYYRADKLKRCLNTLSLPNKIIVWDNNTTGDELEKIKSLEEEFPHVKFVYSKENIGFVRACNQGIILSDTDWVLFCADDMMFDNDWFDVLNNILLEKPYLEQIHLNSFNAFAFHKKTIVRMGWFDEGYTNYPSMEDDDWYLRTVESLGYSPFGGIPEHMKNVFPDWYKKLAMKLNYQEYQFENSSNFTYYCNSIHSPYKIIGQSTITGQKDDDGNENTSIPQNEPFNGMTGIEYHFTKWRQVFDLDELLDKDTYFSKDGRAYKRIIPELDHYPEIRNEYAKKYFNLNLYEN